MENPLFLLIRKIENFNRAEPIVKDDFNRNGYVICDPFALAGCGIDFDGQLFYFVICVFFRRAEFFPFGRCPVEIPRIMFGYPDIRYWQKLARFGNRERG